MSNSPLKRYARIAAAPSAAGCSVITSVAIAAIPSQATAGLQIWNVGQAIPNTPPAPSDLAQQATFNSAFQIDFFDYGRHFWGPNNNLSFINYSSGNSNGQVRDDPAIWMDTVLIGADALNGVASNRGSQTHSWIGAIFWAGSSHTIQRAINTGETGAFGIRFVENGLYHYGWVEVSMDANYVMTVERWALESTANTAAAYSPVGSTAVPGLGGLAALAIGAAGVRSRRQRTVA